MDKLDIQIESILFFKGEPVKLSDLSVWLDAKSHEVLQALDTLETRLQSGGLRLMRKDDMVLLGTAPEVESIIAELSQEELQGDLGRAGIETLTIVLYMGPITRSRVDYIRGVNSTYMLRHLLVRGLIEKVSNRNDKRIHLYRPTFDLLSHIGIKKLEELPEYATVRSEMKVLEDGKDDQA